MKVLVIGSGGREHALAWKIAQSPKIQCVYVAPGNGGTAMDARLQNLPMTDFQELLEWAQSHCIGLTVVGPEGPLAKGVVDLFRAKGLRIVGPTQAAAQLESSKAFSKAFMKRHKIPTADFQTFDDASLAHAHIDALGVPIVIKADGLAAGKGVVVATELAQAHAAVDWMLAKESNGVSHNALGARVVIESFLEGQEASFMVLCNGLSACPLATSQDHKRLLDGDLGPNTGGMGAYSPAPMVSPSVHAKVMREIIHPTLAGMISEGTPFTGFLYAGLMISPEGQVRTLEFNTRLGDPETQPIMMRLKSDLLEVLWIASEQAVNGRSQALEDLELEWDRRISLGVVMASHGYPDQVRTLDEIAPLPKDEDDRVIFHSGTMKSELNLVTHGGRVLCVTALADTISQAQHKVYSMIDESIRFEGMQFRRDIGWRAKRPLQ